MIITFDYYCQLVVDAMTQHHNWRRGQAYFNVLWNTRPDLSEKIRGTALDPFANDSQIDIFLEYVRENWNKEPVPA